MDATHTYTHTVLEAAFVLLSSSLPVSWSDYIDTQVFTSKAEESPQPHFHGAHPSPQFAGISEGQTALLFSYPAAPTTLQKTLLTGLVPWWV